MVYSARKPRLLRLFILELAVFALRGWGRVWVALSNRDRYLGLEHKPPLALYVGVNGLWGCVFIATALMLWRSQALKRGWWIMFFYGVFEAIWFVTFPHTTYDRQRMAFVLGVTAVWVGSHWLLYSWRRPNNGGKN